MKVQWARACFSFCICPHSVPSFYPFTDRQRHLFHHFCFWLADCFSSSPFGHFQHVSAPAGSCARRLISLVKLKSLQRFMLLRSEKIHHQFIFPLLLIFLCFFPTSGFSDSCRKCSWGTDVFSEAALCGYYKSVCLSIFLPCSRLSQTNPGGCNRVVCYTSCMLSSVFFPFHLLKNMSYKPKTVWIIRLINSTVILKYKLSMNA